MGKKAVKSKNSCWDIFDDKLEVLDSPSNYLSFGDMQLIPEFRLALMRQDLEEFHRILWENGADITKPYNVTSSTHRLRTSNALYTGFRCDFTERTDKEFLSTGAASDEAFYHSVGKDLLNELISLDPHKAKRKTEWMQERSLNIDFDVDGEE